MELRRLSVVTLLSVLVACGDPRRDEELAGSSAEGTAGFPGTTMSEPGGGEGGASSSTGADDAVIWDVGTIDAGAGNPCEGTIEFTNIWIANSAEGTVSKIDTTTGLELARYITGPDWPDPSRTSVNLRGDVAVVNRSGGITKIAARVEDCVDLDVDGTIQTSTGEDDVLDWGTDECVIWHRSLPGDPDSNAGGPRPVAWEGGEPSPQDECAVDPNPRVWVGYYEDASESGVFLRLDGATGDVLDEVTVPDWGNRTSRPYGGAVNANGDFWVIGHGSAAPAIKIDADSLAVIRIDNPPGGTYWYGMAVDAAGDPWIAGCNGDVFAVDGGTGDIEAIGATNGCLRGLAIDPDGQAWIAANNPCRLVQVDTATRTIVDDSVPLPGCSMPVGVAIDIEGFVWVVDYLGSTAFKLDPDTHDVVLVNQTVDSPYTYSDMTGAGLSLVVSQPEG